MCSRQVKLLKGALERRDALFDRFCSVSGVGLRPPCAARCSGVSLAK